MKKNKEPSQAKLLSKERELAFDILLRALGPQKVNLQDAIAQAQRRFNVDGPNRGLLRQLVLGVVQWKTRLEWIVSSHFSGYYKAPLPVKVLFLMGAYQLVMLDRIPPYAAVNETVKLLKGNVAPSKFKPIVNGVLREISRSPYPHVGHMKSVEDAIFVGYSHPRWLVRRWLKRWGAKETVALCKANCGKAPFSVRVNLLKTSPQELRKSLRKAGIECMLHPESPEMLIILTPVDISTLSLFGDGLFIPQDLSSWVVPKVLDPKPGERILDSCAAPGIKTTQIATMMDDRGEIVAVERDGTRLEVLKETCERWGTDMVRFIGGDVVEVADSLEKASFHRILVDAPCSDLGIIRRHPEIRWRRKSSDLKTYSLLQGSILDAVSPLLKSDGVLVYSVCSTEPEEGYDVIKGFFKRHSGFVLDDIEPYLPEVFRERGRIDNGTLFVAPHLLNADGFFIARMRKVGP